MNRCVYSGNLARTPELKYSQANKPYCNFVLAVPAGKDQPADFLPMTCFGNTAKALVEVMRKGGKLVVEAVTKQNIWEKDGIKQYSLQLICTRVEFCGNPQPKTQTEAAKQPVAVSIPADFAVHEDDNIPF